jgi:flagellar biosynthesis protein FlhF
MNVVHFLARDAADAIGQVRSRLGPQAVVVILRQLPASRLSRFWRKTLLEAHAALPESGAGILPDSEKPQPVAASVRATPTEEPTPRPEGPRPEPAQAESAESQSAQGRQAGIEQPATAPDAPNCRVAALAPDTAVDAGPPGLGGRWRSGAVLRQMGLQPILVEKVLERARMRHGEEPPAVFADEMALARTALASFWRPAPKVPTGAPVIHAFVGPPGAGKTTALCKWLSKSVLTEGRVPRVWRLDSRTANFPGLLDFHAEVLGVRVERDWRGAAGLTGCDEAFVDLPGVNLQDPNAVEQLQAQLVRLEGAQVHLVLNAAYDASVLLAQVRGFDDWPVSDLILTHLDEEKRLGKLWNFVLGTKFTVRFLSGGQNVPGDFSAATPELLNCQ